MHFETTHETQTLEFAKNLAETCIKYCRKEPLTLMLEGNLGAGKTFIARSMIQYILGHDTLNVPSPTFTLVQSYQGPEFPIWHCDFYRLEDPEEVFELGWDDMRSEGLLLIEWPEKLGHNMPSDCAKLSITIPEDSPKSRIIHLSGLDNQKDG